MVEDPNFFPSDVNYGQQIVTIRVGPGKEIIPFYKNALTRVANYLFCLLFISDFDEAETEAETETASASASAPAERDQADLHGELPETIQAFRIWLYPAFIGLSVYALPQASNIVSLFQLYGFAYRYVILDLQDAIVSVLYEKFANDIDLWYTLGSNKLALEALVKEVHSGTHLYKFVVRALAYTIRLRSEDPWSELCGTLSSSNFSCTAATESRVGEVMESVPSQLWGPIFKEVLLMKTLGDWKQGFCSVVGWDREFLKRCEGETSWGSQAV